MALDGRFEVGQRLGGFEEEVTRDLDVLNRVPERNLDPDEFSIWYLDGFGRLHIFFHGLTILVPADPGGMWSLEASQESSGFSATGGFIPSNLSWSNMPESEVTLPDRVTSDIDRFVESGEFLNWDQAVEELLTLGLSAYQSDEEVGTEESVFTGTVDDQQDPAIADDDPGSDRMY